MAADTAMEDVDFDVDYGMDEDTARMMAEAQALQAQTNDADVEDMNGVEEAVEEGEVDQQAPVPKVHVRGVDSLSTRDVENFANEHYSDDLFKRVEWVDDTSANLVYDTDVAAAEALIAFSAEERADPMDLRPAKRLTTHPSVELFVRQAVEADVKIKNAHVRSTYYLHNSEDPENPHGNRFGKRKYGDRGYRTRDYGRDHGQKRRRHEEGDEQYARRGSGDAAFNENLYDDAPVSVATRPERRDSYSSAEVSKRRPTKGGELLLAKADGRLRDRSASPVRDGDGRYGFADDQPRRQTARPRSKTSPRRAKNNHAARDLLTKELFPGKKAANSTPLTNGNTNDLMDLLPNHASPEKTPRELFPSHKRQEARDIDHEYRTVSIDISRYSLDSNNDDRYNHKAPNKRKENGGDLFARITAGEKTHGRLNGDSDGGFSVKGAGRVSDAGISIRGASGGERNMVSSSSSSSLPKELFPMKAGTGGDGGGGRDLFDARVNGRGRRRRAEDFV
ncbi:hypothetical protein LTR62_005625 [Meristemomyces frigidus]|uniref:Uncharacterized protein n=1 Tax=Meristemomyces frigidus TaxID=1508187 RepID=A0AAN7TD07_9PEZI|nr:hypothetical protein LTR62_005625 [Meristemomyces frigidus]